MNYVTMETTYESIYVRRNGELNRVKIATGVGLVKIFMSFDRFSGLSGPLTKILRLLGVINGLM